MATGMESDCGTEGEEHMSIEAMKQALEALKMCRGLIRNNIAEGVAISSPNPFFSADVDNAITTLRTAIEQAEKQEPVECMCGICKLGKRDWSLLEATQESLREHMAEIKRLKQRQWVGLTDEERRNTREWKEIQGELGPVWAPMMLYLYLAIEAKLKEKNT
jgi:hypothetical protein